MRKDGQKAGFARSPKRGNLNSPALRDCRWAVGLGSDWGLRIKCNVKRTFAIVGGASCFTLRLHATFNMTSKVTLG